MNRPDKLNSVTYKARVPGVDAAMYITISEMDGKPRELFINSKDMPSFPWISYLTRTVSKRLQQGEDIKLLIEEMYQTHDTSGGYIIPKSKGFRAASVVAHIAWVIEHHLKQMRK